MLGGGKKEKTREDGKLSMGAFMNYDKGGEAKTPNPSSIKFGGNDIEDVNDNENFFATKSMGKKKKSVRIMEAGDDEAGDQDDQLNFYGNSKNQHTPNTGFKSGSTNS